MINNSVENAPLTRHHLLDPHPPVNPFVSIPIPMLILIAITLVFILGVAQRRREEAHHGWARLRLANQMRLSVLVESFVVLHSSSVDSCRVGRLARPSHPNSF